MNKLTLEHLAGYLPYGLKYHQSLPDNEHWILEMYVSTIHLIIEHDNRKPILRPLSDLTKEIEVGGEKFVPVDELDKLFEFKTLNPPVMNDGTINMESYFEYQKLLEWHFDIHNLISEGLAIDINTI